MLTHKYIIISRNGNKIGACVYSYTNKDVAIFEQSKSYTIHLNTGIIKKPRENR